jgi:hypothetical protein
LKAAISGSTWKSPTASISSSWRSCSNEPPVLCNPGGREADEVSSGSLSHQYTVNHSINCNGNSTAMPRTIAALPLLKHILWDTYSSKALATTLQPQE